MKFKTFEAYLFEFTQIEELDSNIEMLEEIEELNEFFIEEDPKLIIETKLLTENIIEIIPKLIAKLTLKLKALKLLIPSVKRTEAIKSLENKILANKKYLQELKSRNSLNKNKSISDKAAHIADSQRIRRLENAHKKMKFDRDNIKYAKVRREALIRKQQKLKQ